MKIFIAVLVFLTSICAFPRKRVFTRFQNEDSSTHSNFRARDSIVLDGRSIYFTIRVDSIVVFKDKMDSEYHSFSDCPCIDGSISAHFLCDLDIIRFQKDFCPLCKSKSKYFNVICDSINSRSVR